MLQENPQYKLRREFADWLRRNPADLQQCKGRGWLKPGYVMSPNNLEIKRMACIWEAFTVFKGVPLEDSRTNYSSSMIYDLPLSELGICADQVSRLTELNDKGVPFKEQADLIDPNAP
jgi:hypothetical protein